MRPARRSLVLTAKGPCPYRRRAGDGMDKHQTLREIKFAAKQARAAIMVLGTYVPDLDSREYEGLVDQAMLSVERLEAVAERALEQRDA
jgi:hypothetical protein